MTDRGARILVVDDDESLRRVIRRNLELRQFDVETVADGEAGLESWRRWRPDLIILDLGLPGIDGLQVIREVREFSSVPILVLSAREGDRDKIVALDAGADDYVSKPFSVEELLARIRVALRHAARPGRGSEARWSSGGLELDVAARRVTLDGAPVRLTPTEYELLRLFIAHAGQVLTTDALLSAVWGPGYSSEHHYLHVYVERLRRKLESDLRHPRFILTEPGVGYRFVAEGAEAGGA